MAGQRVESDSLIRRDHCSRVARHGLRAAELYRRQRMPCVGRRCDVDDLCRSEALEIIESRIEDPGYTACLLCDPNGTGGAIFLSPRQDRARRRFSLAHEIGHFRIPAHRALRHNGARCGDAAMRADASDAAHLEWEANDFATELLMPTRLFARDAADRDFSVAVARELASDAYYDVSVTAAAWRMTQLATRPCAIVMSASGTVKWALRSEAMRLPGLRRDTRVRAGTLAMISLDSGVGALHPTEVDVAAWFEPRYPVRARLLESTHVVGSTGQVMSMLRFAEGGSDDASG